MGFFILALTIIVYLIRPAEWIPALYFNWNMLLNGLGILYIAAIAVNKEQSINSDRLTRYLAWFFCAMILSNLFNGQVGTISAYVSQIMSTIIIFLLTQASLTKPEHIKRFILVIVLLIMFIGYQCHLQATVGYNWGGLPPYSRSLLAHDNMGNSIKDIQVVWYGILQDPNDLGMLLVAFAPYIFNQIFFQPQNVAKKIFWILAMSIIVYTVILTNSRGSMLALMGALASFFIIKKRSVGGFIIAGILGLALLAIAPSRMGEVTSGDYSAMGRVYAWILALQLFAMHPIFGIGSQHFLDYHALTTHNSYVLAMVETGILGLFGYLSLFVLVIFTCIKIAYKEQNKLVSVELISLIAGLLGILIAIFFISRTYVLMPFLYVAIMATYARINSPELYKSSLAAISFVKLIFITISFIIFIYIFNRLATGLML